MVAVLLDACYGIKSEFKEYGTLAVKYTDKATPDKIRELMKNRFKELGFTPIFDSFRKEATPDFSELIYTMQGLR